jgi:hypothetical protein
MQWHALLGHSSSEVRTDTDAEWLGTNPAVGALDTDEFDALCGILQNHSADTSRCFFGLSVIENWLERFSADEMKPLLKLPCGRDYIVLTGPLSAVDQLRQGPFGPAVPNMMWPFDRSWLVIGEVDFDSTLIGGSAGMVQAIVESPALEALVVKADTSLAADADKINLRHG